jgi:hypothetical protein
MERNIAKLKRGMPPFFEVIDCQTLSFSSQDKDILVKETTTDLQS